ncbi:glutaredoxin-related protein 5, mitochondrial [Octopus bimaculoides]|uniref:Glutaredoxin-related protein 5, mitochondrial n=1 Tax=Octopus bimaculoides TaxID=37653 RepID=A0A0L8FIP1_OCTBM|nr:glutaredoxin-related protein 5, mitochondrial [Octopus bimaculoides]|eukprot:XP_014789475.1 PREDICTED: glutaredoxin-related protein 5, mitochondrial-like [Octopus bimaculoides]
MAWMMIRPSLWASRMPFSRLLGLRSYSEMLKTGSKDHIDKLVSEQKIVLFMKGTPDAPRCGFSNLVVQILKFHGVEDFGSHNVLADNDLREGIKVYSNWPTIPQVYINGEFVGGCDIMVEKHKSGELIEDFQKIGIRSTLLDREE